MKCIYKTSDRSIAQLLCSALESEGVRAVVDGEHLTSLQGVAVPAGPSAEFRVCVIDPEQTPRATLLLGQWLETRRADGAAAWRCEECGEIHEGRFASCWNCGAERGAT